jgi:hypothetical protein
MKPTVFNGPRSLLAFLFALTCFGVGYLAPHRYVAFAQASSPMPTQTIKTDSVPIGFHVHGQVQIIEAASFKANGETTKSKWKPCTAGKTCTVEFRFQTADASTSVAPTSCPAKVSCLSFTTTQGKVQVDADEWNNEHRGPEARNVAGTIILTP